LSATTIEELLSSQEAHEDAAHTDFVMWCRGAQTKLADRVAFQKERIDELTGAIASYGEKVGELRNATKNARVQPLDALSQDQRLQLIETESEHWRSFHAKDAAERLLKADKELLEGVDAAMHWEEQAISQHRGAREQLLALVHEGHMGQSIEPRPTAAVTSVPSVPAPRMQEAASEKLMPAASLPKSPPALPRALPQAQTKKRVESIAPIQPRASTVLAKEPAAVQTPLEAAPIFGVSMLPALQLVQRCSPGAGARLCCPSHVAYVR
jgi:hypothetical protein